MLAGAAKASGRSVRSEKRILSTDNIAPSVRLQLCLEVRILYNRDMSVHVV